MTKTTSIYLTEQELAIIKSGDKLKFIETVIGGENHLTIQLRNNSGNEHTIYLENKYNTQN